MVFVVKNRLIGALKSSSFLLPVSAKAYREKDKAWEQVVSQVVCVA